MKIVVSSKGQIVIPAAIRKKYEIKEGTELEIQDEDDGIKIVPPAKLEELCNTWKDLDMENVRGEIEKLREEPDEDTP